MFPSMVFCILSRDQDFVVEMLVLDPVFRIQ